MGRVATLLQRSLTEFFGDGGPQRAAAISYYGLFSLFPLAIILVGVFGLVVDDAEARRRVIDFLLDELPLAADEGRRQLERVLRSATANVGGFGLIGLFGLVFSASGVMGSIRHGLNAAWETADARPPLQGKLLDVLLILGLGLAITASFALTVALRVSPVDIPGPGTAQLASLLLNGIIVATLFRLVPAPETGLRDTWPGVLFAAAGIELTKTGFALYLDEVARYSAIYASLGSIIALMVFIFLAANVFLLGAEIASEWPAVRDDRIPDDPDAPPVIVQLRDWLRSLALRRDDPRSPRTPAAPAQVNERRRTNEGPGDEPGPSRAT